MPVGVKITKMDRVSELSLLYRSTRTGKTICKVSV